MKTKLYKRNQNKTIGYAEIITRKKIGKIKEYTITTKKGVVGSNKFNINKKDINVKNKTINDVFNKMISSYLNKGYSDNLKEVQEISHNSFADGSIMPMLLNKVDLNKVKYPCYVQRKYDGMRCITEFVNNSISQKTRENNIINIEHIKNNVKKIFDEQLKQPFDGEIYLHKKDLGDMISIYKNGDTEQVLSYVIYDIPNLELSFEKRRNLLMAIDLEGLDNIKIDFGTLVENEEQLLNFYNQALEEGYEGAVVCDPNSLYTSGFRSNSKMKVKPRETDEFKCVGHYFNKGKMAGQSTLICETKDGKNTFHVKMKGTTEQRLQYAKEFEEKFLNKLVTVEYRKLSKYGVPIEAVGICVRDYE